MGQTQDLLLLLPGLFNDKNNVYILYQYLVLGTTCVVAVSVQNSEAADDEVKLDQQVWTNWQSAGHCYLGQAACHHLPGIAVLPPTSLPYCQCPHKHRSHSGHKQSSILMIYKCNKSHIS